MPSWPARRSSPRMASDRPTTPCLVAEYVAPPGAPYRPACEAMFTIAPRLRGIIRRSADFVPQITPWRLMSTIRWAVASSSSQKRPSCMIPALLTRTSTRAELLLGLVEEPLDRRPCR